MSFVNGDVIEKVGDPDLRYIILAVAMNRIVMTPFEPGGSVAITVPTSQIDSYYIKYPSPLRTLLSQAAQPQYDQPGHGQPDWRR